MKICQYICLQMKIKCRRFHIKTPFTFWDMRTWDMRKICLQTCRSKRICYKLAYFLRNLQTSRANNLFSLLNDWNYFSNKYCNLAFLAICRYLLPFLIFLALSWYPKAQIGLRMSFRYKKKGLTIILKDFIKHRLYNEVQLFSVFLFSLTAV